MSTPPLNKNEENKRVLVVIPTLGQRVDLLNATLLSIRSQYPVAYDIVMIYPLKNLETKDLADRFGAISVEDPGGLSAALNVGISQAKPNHEFISWIGDDDLLATESFKTCIGALDANQEAVLAFGYCDYIDSDGKHLFTSRAGAIAPWLMTWGPNLVPCPGILFRTSALLRAGEFDVNSKYSMDLDMLLRLRKIGKFINTKKVLASFRWHATSTTVANRGVVIRETERVKRKYLPTYLRRVAPVWEHPVRIATKIAAKRVNNMASK